MADEELKAPKGDEPEPEKEQPADVAEVEAIDYGDGE